MRIAALTVNQQLTFPPTTPIKYLLIGGHLLHKLCACVFYVCDDAFCSLLFTLFLLTANYHAMSLKTHNSFLHFLPLPSWLLTSLKV